MHQALHLTVSVAGMADHLHSHGGTGVFGILGGAGGGAADLADVNPRAIDFADSAVGAVADAAVPSSQSPSQVVTPSPSASLSSRSGS